MKTRNLLLAGLTATGIFGLLAFTFPVTENHETIEQPITICIKQKGCVFRTLFGEESSDLNFIYNTPANVTASIQQGLSWVAAAQLKNGGWGAGSHYEQGVTDPHAIPADPATTAMVSMALLRSGNTLKSGKYAPQLQRALNYLLNAVEATPQNATNITNESTQIQVKLGGNIDVILTAQFLTNMLEHTGHDATLKNRTKKCLNSCVEKIQKVQNNDGSIQQAGWAGVLQSSLANNALEQAQAQGANVDKKALEKSRDYQKSNFNASTGEVNTDGGAGVVLYSISGSTRASAKEARRAKQDLDDAKRKGTIPQDAPASTENLRKIGYSAEEAERYSTAYGVYEAGKVRAQQEDVMSGFGSNGGEEFLSYLQTGESMVINKDSEWKKWYENISGRLLTIQNDNGSWGGHHCITSPVFCTATCLLILSINNDIEKLTNIGIQD
jgi:hypothetical protein